jgi:DNA polymerase III delta subunit
LKKIQEELYQTETSILSGKEKPEFAFEKFLANFAL